MQKNRTARNTAGVRMPRRYFEGIEMTTDSIVRCFCQAQREARTRQSEAIWQGTLTMILTPHAIITIMSTVRGTNVTTVIAALTVAIPDNCHSRQLQEQMRLIRKESSI